MFSHPSQTNNAWSRYLAILLNMASCKCWRSAAHGMQNMHIFGIGATFLFYNAIFLIHTVTYFETLANFQALRSMRSNNSKSAGETIIWMTLSHWKRPKSGPKQLAVNYAWNLPPAEADTGDSYTTYMRAGYQNSLWRFNKLLLNAARQTVTTVFRKGKWVYCFKSSL